MKRGKALKFVVRDTSHAVDAAMAGWASLRPFQLARALLLSVLGSACGSSSYTVVDATYGQPEPPPPSGAPELLDALSEARAAWAGMGVVEQAYIPWAVWRQPDELPELCAYPPGTNLYGCWAPWHDGGIYMNVNLRGSERLTGVMAHELGHALRGEGGHLDCGSPSADLMCRYPAEALEVTERDAAWVMWAL